MFARIASSAPSRVVAAPPTLRSFSDFSRGPPAPGGSRKRASDFLGRLAPDDAVAAVDDQPVALPHRLEEPRHGDDGRDAEGAGEDRGMGRGPAPLGHEADDAVARDPDGVGRA